MGSYLACKTYSMDAFEDVQRAAMLARNGANALK